MLSCAPLLNRAAGISRHGGLRVLAGMTPQRVGATGCHEPGSIKADPHKIVDQKQK
jgi:hypothetical protein